MEERNAGAPITVFEITTAVALLLFSRVPADLLVLEVGLGGRFDATNVVDRPAATAITSISMDHMEFLGDTLDKIAWEKAGILKPGVPCAVGADASLAGAATPRRRRPARPCSRAAAIGASNSQPTAACATPTPLARWTCRRPRSPGRTSRTTPASPSPRCEPGTRPG